MPPSRGNTTTTLVKQKRANGRTACDFCRTRKIKCDGETPCSACIRLNHTSLCIVTEQEKARKTPLNQLEEAHKQIRVLQARLSGANEEDAAYTPTIRTPHIDASPISVLSQGSAAAYDNGEEARQARYHGPTSASFHDIHNEGHDQGSGASRTTPHKSATYTQIRTLRNDFEPRKVERPLPTDEELSPIVTAHAAHQQQSEMANVLAGRLDFDGIEPELTMHLLSLHWNRQHHAFLVTYRPLFMRDMAAGSTGKYFSKLLLHAILFGASKFSDRIDQVRTDTNDPSSAGARFLRRIEVLLPEALMTSRITTVQALLLLACTHFARGAESAAWLHSGLAFRMAADLGIFVSDGKDQVAAERMAPEEMELRRRVAWAAYTIDKVHSLYQGRQVSIRMAEIAFPAAFVDKFEEQEYWTPIAYEGRAKAGVFACPVYSVSTFTQLCRLTMVLEEIIECFYGVKSAEKPKNILLEQLHKLHERLKDWHASLPRFLAMDLQEQSPLAEPIQIAITGSKVKSPNVISIHALYQCLVLLLHRPFLPYGHLYEQVSDTPAAVDEDQVGLSIVARSAWKICVDAAWQISHLMSLYRNSVTMKGAPQLISYINLCGTGIFVRLAAQVGRHSDNAHKKTAKAALDAIQACLKDFEENEHPNPGVAKANRVIRRMAHHFNIRLDGDAVAEWPNDANLTEKTFASSADRASSEEEAQFDLDVFLSSFDNFDEIGNMTDPSDHTFMGADVMFGFLKDTQG